MPDVLENILEFRKKTVTEAKEKTSLKELEALAKEIPLNSFVMALTHEDRISIIAEMKKKSPSAGVLRDPYDVADIAAQYKKGGAHALSVLTEPLFFEGNILDMKVARDISGLPILRKDFIFDSYQIVEAKAHGADAVLLIADMLSPAQLKELVVCAQEFQLDTLVEVFTSAVLPAALNSGSMLIGINKRNLRTLKISPDNIAMLSRMVPRDRFVVAESGTRNAQDIEILKVLRVSAVLVGESLLKKSDLESSVRELVEAGKRK